MSGGGKGGPEPIYKPRHTSNLEDQLYGIASTAKPNQAMMGDYQSMMGNVRSGTTLSGQKIPQYQAGSAYNFTTPNVSYAPKSAYTNALNSQLNGMQQDMQQSLAQVNRSFGQRGLGKSGLNYGAQHEVARNHMQNAANARSQYGMQQAKDQIDIDKFTASNDMQRQGMQAQENLSRANQSLQANQAMNQNLLQQIGTIGTLYGQINQEELKPYQLMSQLYGQNTGIAVPSGGGGKGDPFSALLSAGATVFGGPAGGKIMNAITGNTN